MNNFFQRDVQWHVCRAHVWPLVMAALLLALSAKSAIYQRHQTQLLNRQLESARQDNLVLRDELRSLQLEYASITDYEALHNTAKQLGMHEPNFRDGSLVFFVEAGFAGVDFVDAGQGDVHFPVVDAVEQKP